MGAAVVSVEIGENFRLGYEIGSVEGFGDWATTAEKVASKCWWRRSGRGRGKRWRKRCVWCGKGYLGLCVCGKKARRGVCVCAGRRRAQGLRALWRNGEAVERWSGGAVKEFSKTKTEMRGLLCGKCGNWLWLHARVRRMTLPDANLIFQLKIKFKSNFCCHVRWSWKW